MKRNWSEALVRHGSSVWRWAGAMFAAVAMSVGVAPAFAGNATMALSFSQSPALATYGQPATFKVTLTNGPNNTINNVGLTVSSLGATPLAGAVCELSTGLPCSLSGPATASGYQLPANGTLMITVSYSMPQALSPLPTFTLSATGTSSNNSSGPKPAAYTTIVNQFSAVFAPPPPSYPTIKTTISPDLASTVLWSTAACSGSNAAPDCGESYYAQYLIEIKNEGATPTNRPFNVTLTGGAAAFADSFGCSIQCSRLSNVFTIAGLGAGASTSFTVFFKTPVSPLLIDVTATVTIDTPPVVLPAPATVSVQTTPVDAGQTYASVMPPFVGGSAKAKNALDLPNNGKGPFSTRVDVPTYTLVDGTPINIVLTVTPGAIACSPSSPKCLDTSADVQSNGTAVTFGGINQPLNGTNFLVITMVRDWTTLDKKPSSVFNATVWYTDPAGNRTLVKDCANVDLTIVERCVYQRIDMTTSAKGVLIGGYLKFIIWARHNGVYSW